MGVGKHQRPEPGSQLACSKGETNSITKGNVQRNTCLASGFLARSAPSDQLSTAHAPQGIP